MSFSADWNIDEYRMSHESDEHWGLRRRFMERWKGNFAEDRLVCLARVFTNIEFLGCRYPAKVMQLVAELSKEVAGDYREKKKKKLQRTFVSASDAAEDRAKGVKRPAAEQNTPSTVPAPKVFVSAQSDDKQSTATPSRQFQQGQSLPESALRFQKAESTEDTQPSSHFSRPAFQQDQSFQGSERPSFQQGQNFQSSNRPSFQQNNDYQNSNRPSFQQSSDNRNTNRPSFQQSSDNRDPNRPSFQQSRDNRNRNRPSFQQSSDNGNPNRPSFQQSSDNQNPNRPSFQQSSDNRNPNRPSFQHGNDYRHPGRGSSEQGQDFRGSNRQQQSRGHPGPQQRGRGGGRPQGAEAEMDDRSDALIRTQYGCLVLYERPGTFIHNLTSSCMMCKVPLTADMDVKEGVWCCRFSVNGVPLCVGNGETQKEAREASAKASWELLQRQCYTLKVQQSHASREDKKVSVKDLGPSKEHARLADGLGTKVDSAIAERMMKMMGWSGGALGTAGEGISEPIAPNLKQIRRAGLGSGGPSVVDIRQAVQSSMTAFARDGDTDYDLVFASDFSKEERAQMHSIALRLGLKSKSYGKDEDRYLVVSKKVQHSRLVQSLLASGGSNEKFQLVPPSLS